MQRFFLAATLLAGAAIAAGTSTETTLYKSVGPDGRTVYGDRPPVGGPAKRMTFENLPGSPLSASTLAYLEELQKTGAAATAAPAAQPGGVVLFSAAWCGYCKKAKAYLAAKRVAYREVDIETKPGLISYAQAGGQRGVPLLLAKGQRVSGFSVGAYDALFQVSR
jgi:glutaredoxin